MKSYRSFIIAVNLAMLTLCSTLFAQIPFDSHGVWITFGIGSLHPPTSLDLNASYCFAREKACYRLAFDYAETISFGGSPPFHSNILSASTGRRVFGKYYLLVQNLGISLVSRVDRVSNNNDYNNLINKEERRFSPGFHANTQFYVKPLGMIIPEVGIGVEMFGDINFIENFYGVRVSLLFHNTI